MNEENKTESLNPRNLPIIEETSLNDIVLRVRDWQETIDKKFNRKHAYLDFGNEEVNDYKKELLEKGEVDESDVFQNNPEWFHVVKREGKFVDLSNFLFVDINSHDNISKFSATNCECVLDYEEDKNIDFEMVLNFVSINLEDNYIFNKKVELFNCRISIVQTNYPFKLIFEKELNVISTEIDVEGSVELHFNNTCNFNLCTFENMICKLEINGIYNIENCVFKKSIHLLNTVINAKSNFSNVSFEKNIYIDGPIEINNLLYISKLKDTQRDIKIKEKLKYFLVFSYSEFYDEGYEGSPDVYTFGSLAKIYLQNIDFRYLNLDIARIVNYIETLKNNKGQQIINVDWETCEPKPFQHVQHFLSDKKVASFMKDFGAAFETWARIEKNEDILVSVEVVEDGYNVTFESNSEFAINNIGRYKQDFQDAISDKNKLDELKKKADIYDFNELISQIFKILTKQLTYQGKLDTNSLFQLQANPNQLMIQFMQFTQNNHDNSNGIQAPNNQGQIGETISNEPSLEETAKFLDKIKPTKNKFILTCISLVVSSVLGYFINQLPILLGFTDVFKYSVAGFLVLLLALITYLNS